MSGAPAIAHHILGGWQLYWVAYFESGPYFSPSFSGSDPSNTNTFGGLPDRICDGNLPTGQRSINRWFDASCFVVPPQGRFGNSGVSVLQGPGYQLHNASIAKTFDLTERFKFVFTLSASNAFNHPNFAVPNSDTSSPSVGIISGIRPSGLSRRLELRGRIEF